MNNIDRNERKEFKDLYLDGTEDVYIMTFAELEETLGYNDAVKWWNGVNPYEE